MSAADAIKRRDEAIGFTGYYSRRDVNDPEKAAVARREAEAARLEVAVHRALEAAPPLTAEQRERIAALLAGGSK